MTVTAGRLGMVRRFVRTPWGITLLLAAGWQLLMLVIGAVLETAIGDDPNITVLSHMSNWDGGWYLGILNGLYADPASAAPVFYPLFPLLVYVAQTLTFHAVDVLALGLIINTLSLWLALVALFHIVEFFAPKKYGWWAVGLFLASPPAMFLHMFYAEAVFCAVAFWAYLFALRRQWGLMGLLLAIATAARLPALLVVGLCGLEFMRVHGWSLKKIVNPKALWFLLAPAGFVAYGVYLYIVRGDFLAMFHGYELTNDWSYHVFNPNIVYTILREAYHVALFVFDAEPFRHGMVIASALPVTGLAILFAASLYCLARVKDKGVPLGIFGLVSIVFFTINSNTISVHRYLLPAVTIYVTAAILLHRYPRLAPYALAAVAVCLVVQAYLITLFVAGHFAG